MAQAAGKSDAGRRVLAPGSAQRRKGAAIGRGDFPGARLHGATAHFNIWVQPALGGSGTAAGAALRFLAAAIGARAVVEIGTGCGSSGIWLLRGMRPGAVLTSVDTEPEYHRLARKSFAQAGFATNQARLILGRALDVLPRLSDGAYDLVFCDADQAHFPDYLTAGLRLLRVGGIVVFNDALPPSAGPAEDGASELADMVTADERLVPLLLPIAGGMLAAIKR